MDEAKARDNAAKRRDELGLDYAGAVTPEEAHLLAQESDGVIIDVRTDPELNYVGRVPGAVAINWQIYPDMSVNEKFLEQLERSVPKDKTALFLCRSGVRSHNAAAVASQAGWGKSYNILEGFEGDLDSSGKRGNTNGWRFHGLPWEQS